MSTPLTPEQRKRIDENRRLALEKRAARIAQNAKSTSSNASVCASRSLELSKLPVAQKQLQNNGQQKLDFRKFASNGDQSSIHSGGQTAQKRKNDPPVRNDWNVMTAQLSGSLSLISRERFICYIGYNQKLNDVFKSIRGSSFDNDKKKWTFPLDQHEVLRKKIEPLGPNITVGSLPKTVLKMFLNKGTADDSYKSIDISKIEPNLLQALFPFQQEGVRFGISKNGRCLIADEMGLGKTLQALAIADYYHEDWPILVICPSSMRFQWQVEILKYLRKIPSYGIIVVTSSKTFIEDAKVVIISYDLVSKLKDFLTKLKFGILICDESHSLKSGKTARTKAVLEIAKKAQRVLLLSGTPAMSRPKELYYQFKIITPSLFPDKMDFGVRYCDGKHDKFGWNDNGASHLEELKVVLEYNVMIRRLKADVLAQLPSKIRQVIYLSGDQLPTKNSKMTNLEKQLEKNLLKGSEKRSTLLAYYAESGKTKVKAICLYLEQMLEQGKKFLVFAHHKDVLDGICELLEQKQTYYIRIDGSVNSEDRKSVADQFQELEQFRVAVLSITAANTGLTLTAAQAVLFAELYWNPGHLLQAEDRAHRIGQKSCVLIQYLLARGTSDDYIWPLVQTKLSVLKQAGLSKDGQLKISEDHSSQSSSTSSCQAKITEYFGEMEDDIDNSALCDLMDQIDALENVEPVPEKKMKMS